MNKLEVRKMNEANYLTSVRVPKLDFEVLQILPNCSL
jgi:hypothetical protein